MRGDLYSSSTSTLYWRYRLRCSSGSKFWPVSHPTHLSNLRPSVCVRAAFCCLTTCIILKPTSCIFWSPFNGFLALILQIRGQHRQDVYDLIIITIIYVTFLFFRKQNHSYLTYCLNDISLFSEKWMYTLDICIFGIFLQLVIVFCQDETIGNLRVSFGTC